FAKDVVGRGKADFGRSAAANADFLLRPEPVFDIGHGVRGDVDGGDATAQCGIGRSPRKSAAFGHFREDVVGVGAVALFDAVDADSVGEIDGGAQAADRGDVGAANTLKALGSDFFVVPTFGGDRVPEAVHNFIADVEKAGAFGGLEPFVRAGRVHIAAEIVEIELHHARDVSAVDGGENAFRTSESAELFCGKNDARDRGDVTEENDAGARGHGFAEKIENHLRIGDGLGQSDFFYRDAVALGA